ncbi:hypothetical protein BGY98DRAFT_1097990 [Russula aff. rugulosa BPL654]|nr:hypothetical protein BGY98DRAFT_1097990 [Russula aff. rugulosa BPL654]
MTALDGVNGTVCNAQQYQQSLQSSDSRSPWISCLTHGQSIGLAFDAEASVLSFICATIVLIWTGWNVHWYRKTFPNGNWKLFRGPADIYMFSLFVFDILQAIGGILSIRWAHNGIVTTGPFCTVQGLIEQIGELGVALITLLLAVHTFVAAVWQVGLKARGVALSLVCLACVFITLWVAIGAGIHKIMIRLHLIGAGSTLISSWANALGRIRLDVDRTICLGNTIRSTVFLGGGFWSIDEEYKFHWWSADQRVGYAQRRHIGNASVSHRLSQVVNSAHRYRSSSYPLAYSLMVLPLSIARWLQFSHHHVSSAATFFGSTIFHLSGAINVLLFLIIRPELLLFPRPEQLDEEEIVLTPQDDTGAAIFSDTEKSQRSPEPATSAALEDEV